MFSIQAHGSVIRPDSNKPNSSFTATGKRTILIMEEGCWTGGGVCHTEQEVGSCTSHTIYRNCKNQKQGNRNRTINCTSCCAGFTVETGTDGVEVDCLG